MATRKIGRDAGNGQFIPVEKALKNPLKTVVEKIKIPEKKPPEKKK